MPLVALMKSSCRRMQDFGLKGAVYVKTLSDLEKALDESTTTHIFLSPETLTEAVDICQFPKVSHLFVDETHCVVNW